MSETTSCTVEKLLAGFARLSPEDQERVRAELGAEGTTKQAGSCCDPAEMLAHMVGTMKAAGCDPMTMCKEMMERKQSGDRPATPGSGKGRP